jgi:hypothetical protein
VIKRLFDARFTLTWHGSRVELQAVKPAMSAKRTVVSGNKSAMGFDCNSMSLVSEFVDKNVVNRFFPIFVLLVFFSANMRS